MKNFVTEYTYDDASIPFKICFVDAGNALDGDAVDSDLVFNRDGFSLATSFVTLKGLLILVVISSTLESCRFSRLQEVVQTCRFLSATPPHKVAFVSSC